MSTFYTGIPITECRTLPLPASLGAGEKARIGMHKDGTLVVYSGRSFRLHPHQTRRAHAFLRDNGLLQPQQKPRDFRLVDLLRCAARMPHHGDISSGNPWQTWPSSRYPSSMDLGRRVEQARDFGVESQLPNAKARSVSLEARKVALLNSLGTSDAHDTHSLFQRLKGQVGTRAQSACFLSDVAGARILDVPTAAATQVVAPNGTPLPANRVQVGGAKVAIACQHPTVELLESHFSMLVNNRTPVLVVLDSDKEMRASDLPSYFSGDGRYGLVNVTSALIDDFTLEGLQVRRYRMNVAALNSITGSREAILIPVLHVTNWDDRSTKSPGALRALASEVDRVKEERVEDFKRGQSRALDDPNKLLPVIHCRAGVGRTGQLIAARELLKPGSVSLQSIITDMRFSRNHLMVQMKDQLDTLADLAVQQGRPILDSEEPTYENLPKRSGEVFVQSRR